MVKKPPASDAGDTGSIPGSGRSPREGNGGPLQYSRLENPRDRGAWSATVRGGHKESDTTEVTEHMHTRGLIQCLLMKKITFNHLIVGRNVSLYKIKKLFFFLNIYLAVPGLSCSMWDLVSWPRIEPRLPALGARCLIQWTPRQVPETSHLKAV